MFCLLSYIIHTQHYNKYILILYMLKGRMSFWCNVNFNQKNAQTHISNNDMI